MSLSLFKKKKVNKRTVVCQFYHNKLEYNQETKATVTPTAKVTQTDLALWVFAISCMVQTATHFSNI